MFSRFCYINRFLCQKSLSLSCRSFYRGGTKPTKKSSNIRDGKKKNDKKNNDFNNSKNKNILNDDLKIKVGPEVYGLIFSGVLFFYGVVRIVIDTKRLNSLTVISSKTFETDYLLNGEVKEVILPGFITSLFTGMQCEVILYPDEQNNKQSVGVKCDSKSAFVNLIRNHEKDLKVAPNEAVKISLDYTDILFFVAFFTGQMFVAKKMIRQMPKKSSPSSLKIGNNKFLFEIKFPKERKDFTDKTSASSPKFKEEEKAKPMDILTDFFSGSKVEEYLEKSDIKFKDVAGLHSPKQEVKEFLDYLNNPSRFIRLGAKLPRGAMLLGPPGCGKTLLIKALANESNVPFFYKAGSEFVDMIGGVGAQKLRKLFAAARRSAPAIIFLDEIDAIGKKRGQDQSGGDADQTLNQLLVEMDGMDPNAGIVVFAATNRADILDQALIRPGRLDRHILIDLPVLAERKEIFELYLNKYKNKLECELTQLRDKLALQTPGMTGADIANLCNEGALTAAKLNYTMIKEDCFELALERIIAGAPKKNKILNEKERTIVAYHEAGHALAGWLLKYADPILKVSIVPRTNAALGFAQVTPSEKYLVTADMLKDRITVLLAGRVAESIIFNRVTSGAHDDLQKVKKIAFSMIREWGMSEKLGHLSFQVSEEDESLGSFPYSNNTRALIESEANQIVAEAYKHAESVLRANIDKLELLAKELLAKEVLKNVDIQGLIGPRPSDVIL